MKCNYCNCKVEDYYLTFIYRWDNKEDGRIESNDYYFCDTACLSDFIQEEKHLILTKSDYSDNQT
jgi:hypothetical protein